MAEWTKTDIKRVFDEENGNMPQVHARFNVNRNNAARFHALLKEVRGEQPPPRTFNEAVTLRAHATETRRDEFVRAAMQGIETHAVQHGATMVLTAKGFVVVFPNDERMYFEPLEM